MSKITFRADDDLVERVEALETSKSEVMRDALRTYLDGRGPAGNDDSSSRTDTGESGLDELVADRVDALVESRLDEAASGQDVNVTVNLTGDDRAADAERSSSSAEGARRGEHAGSTDRPDQQSGIDRWTAVNTDTDVGSPVSPRSQGAARECAQCGEHVRDDHVYCPNCGEKATRRIFCDCGDELRSDWAYCPGCGRRTPSADVLEQ
jgi:hypothetical protein